MPVVGERARVFRASHGLSGPALANRLPGFDCPATGKNMAVAYLGDEYSHTYACASEICAGARLNGYPTVRAALEAVRSGACETAVVPIENSAEGTVTETLDGICEKDLFICGERVTPVHQNLIGFPGTEIKDLRRVYSHPQALNQCRGFLEREAGAAETVAVAYTSLGVREIRVPTDAAVARTAPAGLSVLRRNIEDSAANATRFVTVSAVARRDGDKASVVFGAPNRPGGLLGALTVLRDLNLNMTKIESRPERTELGGYVFYVDFLFDGTRALLENLLAQLGRKTVNLKFLGRYDRAK